MPERFATDAKATAELRIACHFKACLMMHHGTPEGPSLSMLLYSTYFSMCASFEF